MFKYITDLLFSEEREDEAEVYDEDVPEAESDSEADTSVSDEEDGDSDGGDDSDEDVDDEEDASDEDSEGESESDEEAASDHRCILSCGDLIALQAFVDSIRQECATRGIAIGGSRDVIRGCHKRKRSEAIADGPLNQPPGLGCDPQDPIPCECTKPKEE